MHWRKNRATEKQSKQQRKKVAQVEISTQVVEIRGRRTRDMIERGFTPFARGVQFSIDL